MPASRAGDPLTGTERGVPVPSDDDQHVRRQPAVHREHRVLQRGDGARATHVDGGREPERLDAQVGRQLLARGEAGRRDDAVDVADRQPRVRDRGVGRPQHQLHGQVRRPAHVVGLADPHDGGLPADAGRSRPVRHGAGSYSGPRPPPSALATRVVHRAVTDGTPVGFAGPPAPGYAGLPAGNFVERPPATFVRLAGPVRPMAPDASTRGSTKEGKPWPTSPST